MVIYNELFNIIREYVYGNPETLDSFQTLVATEMATIGSFVVVALPLIAIFWLIKFVFSVGRGW